MSVCLPVCLSCLHVCISERVRRNAVLRVTKRFSICLHDFLEWRLLSAPAINLRDDDKILHKLI